MLSPLSKCWCLSEHIAFCLHYVPQPPFDLSKIIQQSLPLYMLMPSNSIIDNATFSFNLDTELIAPHAIEKNINSGRVLFITICRKKVI